MKTNTTRRCTQCTRWFVPDPRVDARQVTCGASECQRSRHSERCKSWHAANAETAASHYEDVVRPFRARQPSYQRRWRLGRRLREIREEMTGSGGGALRAILQGLLGRAEALFGCAPAETQTGVLAANLLDEAAEAMRGAIAGLEQFEASVATLQSMGL